MFALRLDRDKSAIEGPRADSTELHVLKVHVEAAGRRIVLTLNTVMCDINKGDRRQGQARC